MTCWQSSAANKGEATVLITLQNLTLTQSVIIRCATQHPEGKVALPAALQGGTPAKTLKWLLMRGWIDLEHCPNCGGELKSIAAILEQPVAEKILTHLGLQARTPPRAASRSQSLQAA